MHYQTSYQLDEDLVISSTKQTFFSVYLKKKWIGILGFYLLALLLWITPDSPEAQVLGYIVLAVASVLTILWMKSYFAMLSHAKSAFHAQGGGLIEVTIDDEQITLTSPSASRTVKLDKVTKVIETKDFLILMTHKTPVFTPLKKELNPEAISWLLKREWTLTNQV